MLFLFQNDSVFETIDFWAQLIEVSMKTLYKVK